MDVVDIIKRASDRCGFSRDHYVDANVPTLPSNILILLLFGDVRSTQLASSFVLKRYKEMRANKYLILCSWPGHGKIFPYVDEFWSIKDQSSLQALASDSLSFYNHSDIVVNYNRFLNNYFENVLNWEDVNLIDQGFTPKYWEQFKDVKLFLPEVPSSTNLPEDFRIEMGKRKGKKVVIFPAQKLESWQGGRLQKLTCQRDFWCALIERLIQEGICPIVYQNWHTYDLSRDFADKCIWLTVKDMGQVLSAMRWSDCVLDVHSGICGLATMARTPCLIVDERKRYIETKSYEFDDLTNLNLRSYMYSFSTMLMSGDVSEWKDYLLDGIVSRLNKWSPIRNNDISFGSPAEYYDHADYEKVRQYKAKRLGVYFIKKR